MCITSKNHIKKQFPQINKLYQEAVKHYEEQLNRLYGIKGKDNDEIIFKLIILQFSIIANQCLTSIYQLLQTKEFFTPLTILRNMVEYAITSAYIEQNPKVRARQYAAQGTKIKLKLINAAEKYPEYQEGELKGILKIKETVKSEYEELKTENESWQEIIEQRAIEADIPHIYDIQYRLLSMYTHPNSNTSNEFFTDTPDGKTIVHKYKRDTTTQTLATAIGITNTFMARLDELFNLGQADKYEEIKKRITRLP